MTDPDDPVYARVSEAPYTRAGTPMHRPKPSSIEEPMHTRKRREYRYPGPTDEELRGLKEAYLEITGRTVWPKMVKLIATCWRMHGPSTASVIAELHAEFGVTDLLRRTIGYGEDEKPSTPAPVLRINRSILKARHNGGLHVDRADPDCPYCATVTEAM
jgi:hypothetical protein